MTGLEKVSRRRAVTGIVVSLMLVGLVSVCPSVTAAPRGCEGRLAFDSVRGGNRDIYAIVPPARGTPADAPAPPVTRLTTSPASDAKPSWSPPALICGVEDPSSRPTLIAFQRASGDTTDIWTFNVRDGTESVEPVIDDGAAPAWAPKDVPVGSDPQPPSFTYPPIAFEREGENGKRDIFVANYNGSGESNVTETPDVDEANPEWASTWFRRAHLAFDSDRGGRREVWVMDLQYVPAFPGEPEYEQVETRQVTAGTDGSSVSPSWFAFTDPQTLGNPDNLIDSIAFAGPDQDGANSHIHYVESDRDGPFPRRDGPYTVTRSSDQHAAPAWSPLCLGEDDETLPPFCRMAYQRTDRGGDAEIYVMDPFIDQETDVNDLNVTKFPGGDDRNPDWQASGLFPLDVFKLPRPRGRRSKARSRGRPQIAARPPLPPIRLPGPTPESECPTIGTPGNDVLCGTSKRDVLRGKGGNDTIRGGGGNDKLLGGAGNDRILGGRGPDEIRGEAGDDRLDGGPGRDHISGGSGRDKIKARDRQRDRISGGRGSDRATVDGRLDRVGGVEGRG